MPGGAPLRKPRAKKPRAPKKPRAKKPCKYGPRDADGYCPKKPRREYSGNERIDAVLGAPVKQRGRRSKTVGQHLAEAGEKTAKKAADEAARKLADKFQESPQEGLKAMKKIATALVIPAIVAALWSYGSAKDKALANRFALRELTRTQKTMKRPLSQVEMETLTRQYVDYVKQQIELSRQDENKNPAVAAKAQAAKRFLKSI